MRWNIFLLLILGCTPNRYFVLKDYEDLYKDFKNDYPQYEPLLCIDSSFNTNFRVSRVLIEMNEKSICLGSQSEKSIIRYISWDRNGLSVVRLEYPNKIVIKKKDHAPRSKYSVSEDILPDSALSKIYEKIEKYGLYCTPDNDSVSCVDCFYSFLEVQRSGKYKILERFGTHDKKYRVIADEINRLAGLPSNN